MVRSNQQVKSIYDRMGRWYDLLASGFENKHRNAGIRKLAPAKGDTVLEIGCGTGRSIVALAELVGASGKIYGLDISEQMLDITRWRAKRAGVTERVLLVRANALQLPFKAGSFESIFISFTLELFDDPEIQFVLLECLRVLRIGGRICIVGLSKKGGANAMTRVYEWLHEKFPWYIDCRPIFVQEALEKAGFHTLDTSDVSLLGLHIECILAEKPSKI
ncbi:MAG: class I SAM-dependent methyltransferase [Synergistales bacterium]|nr:class I SAM-dependent methyltransferase [Synergistales bacterium]